MWLKDGTFRGWNLFGVHKLNMSSFAGVGNLGKVHTPYMWSVWNVRRIKQSECSVTSTPKTNAFHHPTVCLSKDCSTLRAMVIKPLMNDFGTKTVLTSTHIRRVALNFWKVPQSHTSKIVGPFWEGILNHFYYRPWWFPRGYCDSCWTRALGFFGILWNSLTIAAGSNLKTWLSEWSVLRWTSFQKCCLWPA